MLHTMLPSRLPGVEHDVAADVIFPELIIPERKLCMLIHDFQIKVLHAFPFHSSPLGVGMGRPDLTQCEKVRLLHCMLGHM